MEFQVIDYHRKRVTLNINDIDIVEADTKYVNLYTKGEVYIHDATVKDMLAMAPDDFVEVKRGKLIRRSAVKGWFKDKDGELKIEPNKFPTVYPKLKISRKKAKLVLPQFSRIEDSINQQ